MIKDLSIYAFRVIYDKLKWLDRLAALDALIKTQNELSNHVI